MLRACFLVILFLNSGVFAAGQCVFLEPPEGFSPQFEVAGCYCESQKKVLFLLRNPDKPQGNSWCVPGGKLEKGESPLDAIVREVWEETGLRLKENAVRYRKRVYVRFPDVDFVLHLFRAKLDRAPKGLDLAQSEHVSYCWVTWEEALELPLIPGGKECLQVAR